jgi:anti-sigma factor RsiW
MTPETMTCKELVELVTDYIEETLPPSERARFEAHLATCDGCDRYLAQMGATIRSVGALHETDVSPEAEEKLLGAFRRWRATEY